MFHKRVAPEALGLPSPPPPAAAPAAFVLCPVGIGLSAEQKLLQQCLYQQAFEEAQRVVQPSILERDLLGVWN